MTDEELDELETWLRDRHDEERAQQALADLAAMHPAKQTLLVALGVAGMLLSAIAVMTWDAVCWVVRFLSQEVNFEPFTKPHDQEKGC